MKAYGRVEKRLHTLLTSVLEGGDSFAPTPLCPLGNSIQQRLEKRLGGPVSVCTL
jgi:hypothetical protein